MSSDGRAVRPLQPDRNLLAVRAQHTSLTESRSDRETTSKRQHTDGDAIATGGQAAAIEQAGRSRPKVVPDYSGLEGRVRHADGRTVRLVDAPSVQVAGTRYRVDRRHPTSAMVAIRKAANGEAETPRDAKLGFDQLVETVRDVKDPMVSWKSYTLFEGIRDYLDQRLDRANRTSEWAEVLSEMPTEDRVVRLDRGLRALARAFSAGKLPGVEKKDLLELQGRTQATAFNFDMDHNVFHLPGYNYVLNEKTGDVKAFDHGEWAKMRQTVGQPGPLADYKTLSSDLVFGTFQEADDGTDPGGFERSLRTAVGGPESEWQAPMWPDFKWALERPESAKNVFITTARGHFPRTIYNGLRSVMQAEGRLAHVPAEDHIFPVTAHGIAESSDYSQEKVRFIRISLDQVQAQPFGPASGLVRRPDGKGSAMMHTFVFSDDDIRTANLVVDSLQRDQAAGRWPDVKVIVRFTGQDHPDSPPWAKVVGAAEGPREASVEELQDHVALRARGDRARARLERLMADAR